MANTSISFTPGSAGNLNQWTISLWLKRANLGVEQVIASCYENSNYQTQIKFTSDDELYFNDENNGNTNGRIVSTANFRDPTAWMNLVFVWDKDNGTAGDKLRMYANGTRITSFSDTGNAPSTSSTWNVNGQAMQFVAKVTSDYFEGCMSHIHFCDGYAYAPSDFGEIDSATGEWKIITNPSVSYGTNGYFILKNSNSVTDESPNSNNFSVASGTLTNTEDCPSSIYSTFNTLEYWGMNGATIANGATTLSTASAGHRYLRSTLQANKGKFYAEFKIASTSGAGSDIIGITDHEMVDGSDELSQDADSIGYVNDGSVRKDGSNIDTGEATYTTGDIIGVAMDLDNSKIYFHKNGTYINSGNPSSSSNGYSIDAVSTTATGFYHFGAGDWVNPGTNTWSANFGNGYFGTTAISSEGTNASGIGKFEYDVPSGYTALSTKGLNE